MNTPPRWAPLPKVPPTSAELGALLESVYSDCHRPELIDPDPLLVVRGYPELEDREIVALFCAAMALGRASAIVASCRKALAPFGPNPFSVLKSIDFAQTLALLSGFKYRFFDAQDAAALLSGAASLRREAGSLESVFAAFGDASHSPYPKESPSRLLLARCDAFVERLLVSASAQARTSGDYRPLARNLFPAPKDGSACKRLMLFLRWMVRHDSVDPGGWTLVSPSELVLPLDTHLHRISLRLGMTERKAADLRSALEISETLRSFDAADPIRFDFSLARLGIRSDFSLKSFYRT